MKHSFIKRSGEFKFIGRTGKAAESRSLRAKYSFGKTSDVRLGIVVSKANIANSVGRNRVRRILKEAFRNLKDIAREPIDIIVFAKASAKNLEYGEATGLFKQIFEKP